MFYLFEWLMAQGQPTVGARFKADFFFVSRVAACSFISLVPIEIKICLKWDCMRSG